MPRKPRLMTRNKQCNNPLKPYGKRNGRIRANGLGDGYQDYLQSDLWKSIRQIVLERDSHTCRICGAPAQAVHHSNYSMAVLSGRSIVALFSICNSCHKFIEFKKDGSKSHLKEVRNRIRLLCSLKGKHGYDPIADNQRKHVEESRKKRQAARSSEAASRQTQVRARELDRHHVPVAQVRVANNASEMTTTKH